jgi:phage terminase large subunit-like protein
LFSEAKADRAVNFFERVLVHTKGEYAGKPFILTDWQKDLIIRPLFGTVNPDGTRQYRIAYISTARKNGKSELAAGIALYLLSADDEPGAEVYGAAADKEQASIVFDVASEMVKRSAYLSSFLRRINSRKRVVWEAEASFYQAIPADEKTSHGFNAHGVIVDELHVQPKRDLWDVLTTSTGTRRQPLVAAFTTAGFDRYSICWEQYDYAKRVARGAVNDPTFFSYIAEPNVGNQNVEDDDDWEDPATWAKANPALDDYRRRDELETAYEKAKATPAYQNTFKRLYLNIWTSQIIRWLDLARWDASAGEPFTLDDARGRDCVAGLDLASTTDIAALVLVFPSGEGSERRYDVLPFFFMPKDTLAEAERKLNNIPLQLWADQGYIIATEGDVIDYGAITDKIDELAQAVNIKEVGFDRWGATQLIQGLENSGMTVIAIGQGFASMSAPTKETLNLIIAKKLRHGGNPVLRWMADNMVVKEDSAGNQKPEKAKSSGKIDGIVATIMGVDRATRQPSTSVYEERGLTTV